ncbi:hypothetical protein L6R52_34820 [Myxococcota bacterium]|nr:hypothetical protein [Myxococcota bacterium]
MSTLATLVCVAALALPSAAPSRAKKGEPRRASHVGSVVGRTKTRVYFDRGTDAGFTVGAKVEDTRDGRTIGTCVLEKASATRSSCEDRGVFAVGDTIRLTKPAAPDEPAPDAKAPSNVHPGQRRVEAVPESISSAPVDKVVFERKGAGGEHLKPRGLEASASAGWLAWTSLGVSESTFQRGQVDVTINSAPLFAGISARVDLSARGFVQRPESLRFRAEDAAQLYVYEAALEVRELGTHYVVSAGRIRPWRAPGLVLIDGVQAGLRTATGSLEGGGFAGVIPELATLGPATDRWTAGGYWSATGIFGKSYYLRNEGRVALLASPADAKWGEAESLVHAHLADRIDLGAGARVAFGGDVDGSFALDALRVDAGVRATDDLRFTAGYRERHASAPDLDPTVSASGWLVEASRRGDVGARWSVGQELVLGLDGGFVSELDTVDDQLRGWVGPEVSLPSFFGPLGGLTLGYQEERGWLDGRMLWAQSALRPHERLALFVRLSYLEDTADDATLRELGVFGRATWTLSSWLTLNATLLTRTPIADVDGSLFSGLGVLFRTTLTGTL